MNLSRSLCPRRAIPLWFTVKLWKAPSIIIQYNFLPSGALYNIQIMAPDADQAFYQAQKETYTDLYGSPLTEDDASLETENAVAVMMALLMRSAGDTDYLGWQADDETVIIISREPVYKVCYVEIRRYTDYFRFE